MIYYLIDTNILLNNPAVLDRQDVKIVVTSLVLFELDKLKSSKDIETAYKARKAIKQTYLNLDKIKFIDATFDKTNSIDDQLIDLTQELNNSNEDIYYLYTGDIMIAIKAHYKNIQCILYKDIDAIYSGIEYYEVVLDEHGYNEELDLMLEDGKLPEGVTLNENQYLFVTDDAGAVLAIMVYRHNKLRLVKQTAIKNDYIKCITPRNYEQICLFDMLNNQEISILNVNGVFGSGKTFCILNYAFQELDRGHIDKIVFVPNNAFTEDTVDLGSLPGELYEKIYPQIGCIIDIIGEDRVEQLLHTGELVFAPMQYIRGRSFDNAIIIVNEAQNLTTKHIKLLLGRIGEGSRIFFDGDIKQTDNSVFRSQNGLKLLTKLAKSAQFSKIFASVRLKQVERSFAAQTADYLDQF